MTFLDHFNQLQWDELKMTIHSQTAADVENALHSTRLNHQQFLALISPQQSPISKPWRKKAGS